MKPTNKQLALRDPALAALVGALPGDNFGVEFGDDFDDYGTEFADPYGADAPAGAMGPVSTAAIPAPTPQQAMALWRSHHANMQRSQRRGLLLEPNKGSSVKIERYVFSVSQVLTLGSGGAGAVIASNNPDVTIRPQRVSTNAPTPSFVLLDNIKVANVSVVVGGLVDAFDFNANGVGQTLDMPTLTPSNRASVSGEYTGLAPSPFSTGSFTFIVSFKGPATITA